MNSGPSTMFNSKAPFVPWEYTAESDSVEVIFPDGCRDILIVETNAGEKSLLLTDWDDQARSVELTKGQTLSGFRLRPGLTVNLNDLAACEVNDVAVRKLIEEVAGANTETTELVDVLSSQSVSLASVAKQAGVSVRTLQRHFKTQGLPKPEYWRLLSRARTAAVTLTNGATLSELAVTNGYSDQAHMTREFVRWFGATPAQIRSNSQLNAELSQPGLGNWTLEQISIRKPLGSDT